MNQSQANKISDRFLEDLEDLMSRSDIEPALAYAILSFKMHKMRVQKEISLTYALNVLEHSLLIIRKEMEQENGKKL